MRCSQRVSRSSRACLRRGFAFREENGAKRWLPSRNADFRRDFGVFSSRFRLFGKRETNPGYICYHGVNARVASIRVLASDCVENGRTDKNTGRTTGIINESQLLREGWFE